MDNMTLTELKDFRSLLVRTPEKELLMEGINLVEFANMFHLSSDEFFKILPMYLRLKDFMDYQINSQETSSKDNWIFANELMVPKDKYERIKQSIFDLAYIGCSKIGDSDHKHWACDNASGFEMYRTNKSLTDRGIFHAIYTSVSGGYNIKASDVVVDKEEYEEKYNMLKR